MVDREMLERLYAQLEDAHRIVREAEANCEDVQVLESSSVQYDPVPSDVVRRYLA